MTDKYRGNEIEIEDNIFVYSDTKESVELFDNRNCGKCKQPRTKEGHDPCLGEIKNVMNVCCGHGDGSSAYIQFYNGLCLRGIKGFTLLGISKLLNRI